MEKSGRKITMSIIKLLAIAVSIFVFSYAWFTNNIELNMETIEVGTAKSNNVEISQDGESDWGYNLSISEDERLIFNHEITSDGLEFYKALAKNDDGTPKSFAPAIENQDYLKFDLWFKNPSNVGMFLEDTSTVYPQCCDSFSNALSTNNPSVDRLSSYGSFSRDLIAASVRIAFIKYIYDENTDTYVLDDEPVFIWAPNKNVEVSEIDGVYTADIESTSTQDYSHIKVNSQSSFEEENTKNIKDTIKASYNRKSSGGDEMLAYIKASTEEEPEQKAGIQIRVWVEGQDRETNEALRGGRFKFNLSFVGISKELNESIPAVSLSSSHVVNGLDSNMEYSFDNGNNWTGYNSSNGSVICTNSILVRYKETDTLFSSEPIKLSV